MPDQIFISYRRDDSAYVTGHINDLLRKEFGDEAVFTDVDNIPPGADFRSVLGETVSQCQVFLAVMGSGWINAKDREGQRRLLDPADFVRIEIESALERNIPVIPLLVDGVKMPPAEDLPESLRGLAFRNGISVRPAPDFSVDMARLVKYLRRHFGSTEAEDPGTAVRSEPRPERRATDQPPPAKVESSQASESTESETAEERIWVAEDESARRRSELGIKQAPRGRATLRWLVAVVVVAGAAWYLATQQPEIVDTLLSAVQTDTSETKQNPDAADQAEVDPFDITDSSGEEEIGVAASSLDSAADGVPGLDQETATDTAESIANGAPEKMVDESLIGAAPAIEATGTTSDQPAAGQPAVTEPAEQLTVDAAAVAESADDAEVAIAESTDSAPLTNVEEEVTPTPDSERQSGATVSVGEGVRLAAVGEHEAAIQIFDEVIQRDVEPAFAYRQRAASYRALGQHEAAITDYDAAIKLNEEDVNAYYNRGASHFALQDYASAIADYDAVILLDPEYVQAYSRRADAQDAHEDTEEAVRDPAVVTESESKQDGPDESQ